MCVPHKSEETPPLVQKGAAQEPRQFGSGAASERKRRRVQSPQLSFGTQPIKCSAGAEVADHAGWDKFGGKSTLC